MDPALSSLFPIHQIGADGFSWWVGQVESGKDKDPKKSGRYQVRVIGQHLKDGNSTPTESLPWAQVMLPVTTPFSVGGKTGASIGLDTGSWVVGFYLDNDKQKPIIMGSIGHTAGATQRTNIETDPNPGGTEKGFATYLAPGINPSVHAPISSKDARKGDQPATAPASETSGATRPGEAGVIAAAVTDQMPPAFYGLFAEASATNPTGSKVCVEIANPNCGSENDMKGGLTKIIADMLRDTQQSNGNLGSFYVSKINGELNSYIDTGMSYVNKAVRLVKSFVSRVKGEIVKQIRQAADGLVELLLYEKVVEENAEDAAEAAETSAIDNGEEPEEPKTKKQSRLKVVLDTINETLDDVGCKMADFTDRIAQWLTDLLLGYLMDAFANAACLVDNVVDGILNQIVSFLEELIGNILGPLQQLLSVIAAPIDMIGNAINSVLNLLGISCDGLPGQCEKIIKECTDCGTGEAEDWLDKLIGEIEDGPLDASTYVCDEAKNTSALDALPPTNIIFIGGTYPEGDPGGAVVPTNSMITYEIEDIEVTEGENATFVIKRSGAINFPSSVTFSILGGTATQGEDYDQIFSGSSVGFAPGSFERTIVFETYKDSQTEGEESFFVKIEENVTPEGTIATFKGGKSAKCTILDFQQKNISPPTDGGTDDTTVDPPFVPPSLVNVSPITIKPFPSNFVPDLPEITISSDKIYYTEGETIKYVVTTTNAPGGITYDYTVEGTIDANDIQGGSLSGAFTTDANGIAQFEITTLINDDVPDTTDDNGNAVVVDDITESISVYITGTPAYTDAFILGTADTQVRWSVDSDKTYVREGETATVTVSTVNIPDGTNFTYELIGTVTYEDIVGARIISNVDVDAQPLEIKDGQCIIPVTPTVDGKVEESEYFDFTIKSYVDTNGDVQTVDDVSTQIIILAEDAAEEEDAVPSYFVTTDQLTVEEGGVVKYIVTTNNVTNGTVLQYMLSGSGIKPSDFSTNSLFGKFQVINNESIVYIGIEDDTDVEQNETVTFTITGTGASADVVILASDEDFKGVDPDPGKPCFDKPVAGKPITDDSGSIISIPIVDSGCPYVLPPKIIITGPGYGAGAIPLLDSNGRVSEVRVTRSGVGYNVNQDPSLRCVIDAYTIISPGQGYTSAPDVYIDGVIGRAEAIIDDRGFIVSIRPTDRTNTYNEIPQVRIIGGGGLGARVIPSIVCLDNTEYEDQGYAKIGTGRYVDCP